jgi:threonine aldolase
VQVRAVQASGLVMHADDLRRAMRPPSRYAPAPSLVCLENTHNGAGGKITPLAELRALCEVARERELPVHMDGARLWNASVASGTSLADFAACADTVMVAFSKGLGAPVGAALAGSRAAMDEAWTARKLFGGALRQSGMLAAAALHGLDHHLVRLADDHVHARLLADAVDGAGGARVVPPDTNIVMIDLPAGRSAESVCAAAAGQGVRISAWTPTRIRAVTHLDVTRADVVRAGQVVATLLASA